MPPASNATWAQRAADLLNALQRGSPAERDAAALAVHTMALRADFGDIMAQPRPALAASFEIA